MVGRPYLVAGKRYVPRADPTYVAVGAASWYGTDFHEMRMPIEKSWLTRKQMNRNHERSERQTAIPVNV